MSRVYPFTAYDKHMSLKLDSNMWLIIVYFLRPFILKVSTIQMGRSEVSLMPIQGTAQLHRVMPARTKLFVLPSRHHKHRPQ